MMPLDTCCMNLDGAARHNFFVANNVSSFAANIRKLVYSLWRSLNASDIVLINAALRSDLLARSPVLDDGATFCFNFYPRGANSARVIAIIVCLCVCVSHAGIVSKRLNVGSRKQHRVITQGI